MEDITQFADVVGTISDTTQMDSPGSSVDVIFAEAIIANEPTSVLEENGIVTVQVVPADVDRVRFPIVRNTQFTWTDLGNRIGSNYGSELSATGLNQVEYVDVRPSTKSATLFLADEVSLMNKVNFDLYSRMGATESKRKKEADTLATLTTEANHTNIYAAQNFESAGSVTTGSTLKATDLLQSKKVLSTGSDINVPDFVLVHPNQYYHLNTDSSFAPGATSPGAMVRKAQFDENGNITKFDGMDIFSTELVAAVTGSPTTSYLTDGHTAIIGARGLAVGRGEHFGIKVTTQDDRLKHGQYKIFDIDYDTAVLVKEALVLIRCSDT